MGATGCEASSLPGRDVIGTSNGGGSDDIGDVSWVVPTITLMYPANIAAGPGPWDGDEQAPRDESIHPRPRRQIA